jgi:hypothetical protein
LTNGFRTTAGLPEGDLFSLPERLLFSVFARPTDSAIVFPVNSGTFGGSPQQIGAYPGFELEGLAATKPNSFVRALSGFDRVRDMSFVLAGSAGSTGDRLYLSLQTPSGTDSVILAEFLYEANGVRLVDLHTLATLRVGGQQLAIGSLLGFNHAAGSAGLRTDEVTLRLNRSVSSPLLECGLLKIEMAHTGTSGSLSIVITDVVVARNPLPEDPNNPGLGLIGQLDGGYPTGRICAAVTAPCLSDFVMICLRSANFWSINLQLQAPSGLVIIPGFNANAPVSVQGNIGLIRNILMGGGTGLSSLSREYVASQLTILALGGATQISGALKSPLRGYDLGNPPIKLSNGYLITPFTTLEDVFNQVLAAIKANRSADYQVLANLLSQLNIGDASGCGLRIPRSGLEVTSSSIIR